MHRIGAVMDLFGTEAIHEEVNAVRKELRIVQEERPPTRQRRPLSRPSSSAWRYHQPTVDDVARRTADGRTKREIIRCLKRFRAREIYQRVMTDFRARQAIHPGRLNECLDI